MNLLKPFTDAIKAEKIEGVIIQGRDTRGTRYSQAFGQRALLNGTQQPLSTTDILFLASANKLLTSVAALQCCDKGLLSLDTDLGPTLPALRDQGVVVDDDSQADSLRIEPITKPLTLRHLLTHSSGLSYGLGYPIYERWQKANPKPADASDVQTKYLTPLAFQPGEEWMYGTGIDWAGRLVEKVTETRLDEYFQKHIFAPLRVPATEISFFPVQEGLGARMPDLNPNDRQGLGLSSAMGNNVHKNVRGCFGGQGGYASSEAYIAVLQSLLLDDGRLLSKAARDSMFQPQLEKKAKESLLAALKGPWAPWFDMNTCGPARDYGLGGLLVEEDEDCGMGRHTITWGGGCNSAWFIDPVNGVCGFLSLQLGLPPDTEKALELKGHFRRELKNQMKALS